MLRVYVNKIGDDGEFEERLHEALDWIRLSEALRPDSRVFIKPNLTYPSYKAGVTTSPEIIEALVKALREFSSNIVIGESDGGYYSWKAEDAFRGHGIDQIARRYGVKALNLSKLEKTHVPVFARDNVYQVSFPRMLKEEIDLFITMPVPKVHCMTGVSLAMKNQWGCIPDTMRLSFHHIFDEAILEINKNLPRSFAVADGRFFLDGTGPMYGKPVRKDLLIASSDIGSFEVTLCEIMGVSIEEIPHLRYAKEKRFLPQGIEEIELSSKIDHFKYHSSLCRSVRNRIMHLCFKSELLTYLLYTSSFGKALHKMFYKIRGTPDHLKEASQNDETPTH